MQTDLSYSSEVKSISRALLKRGERGVKGGVGAIFFPFLFISFFYELGKSQATQFHSLVMQLLTAWLAGWLGSTRIVPALHSHHMSNGRTV